MNEIKRPDYSNGILSLSSKPLSIHHNPASACAMTAVWMTPALHQSNVMPNHASGHSCNSA
jgi:hypothetical protein